MFGNVIVCGCAEIHAGAKVHGDAKIEDTTQIYNTAEIYGNAIICDHSRICDDAKIWGNTILENNAYIRGNARISSTKDYIRIGPLVAGDKTYYDLTSYKAENDKILVINGDSAGTIKGFESFVMKKYTNDDENIKLLNMVIAMIKQYFHC